MRRSDHGLDLPRGEHWSARALCTQLVAEGSADPDDWHPIREAEDDPATKRTKRWCRNCLVRRECLDDALARGDEYGIRGGLTSRERRALKAMA